MSMDPTASGGGYIGDMELSQMDARLRSAAANLDYGEMSGIIKLNDRCVILQRMPRDFKERAAQVFQQATAPNAKGDLKAAVEKGQEALRIYPYFLRALVFMGTSLGAAETRSAHGKFYNLQCSRIRTMRPRNSILL